MSKFNTRKFNKDVSAFNNRLKKALKKGNINKDTYKALLIDKPAKDFYRKTIKNKKDLTKFSSLLKKANADTLKPSKREFSKIGDNFNNLAKTRYEKIILKEQLQKNKYLKETFGHKYSDYIIDKAYKIDNKKGNTEEYYKLFNRLKNMDFEVDSRDKRYVDNWKKAYKERFGKSPRIHIDDPRIIKEMLKNPNLAIDNFYDPFSNDKELEEDVKRNIKEIKDKIKKGQYEDDDNIDIDELMG